jgi:GDP/UDP-N,N'-diacetylbacillosamine 2-epimerase (hydrolysing)
MSNKRKICVVTSSRADYWLLKELITLLHNNNEIKFYLAVTGSHLLGSQGYTASIIESDGFKIDIKINSCTQNNTNEDMAKSIAATISSFTDYFSERKPDLIVVLGDRFEIMGVAISGYSLKIPIAHIHGGEATYGALDDNFRHVITKMSSLHFPTHEIYAKRIRQLGENPDNIHVYGAPCLDQILKYKKVDKEVLFQKLKLNDETKYVLCCYHPCTVSLNDIAEEINVAENILNALLNNTKFHIIITKANIDPNGEKLNEFYDDFMRENPTRVSLFGTLGGEMYFNTISYSEFVIGNSSSGIIEVPYFKKSTINIGQRQAGRITASSVYSCATNYDDIVQAIKAIQQEDWYKANVIDSKPIYGIPGKVAEKIYNNILNTKLDGINNKVFYDL